MFCTLHFVRCNRVYCFIKEECLVIRVIILYVADSWLVICTKFNLPWSAVVQVWKSNFVLSPDLMSHNYLVDIIELVPILILLDYVTV